MQINSINQSKGVIMKYTKYLLAIAALLFVTVSAQAQTKKDGKSIFEASKCNMCHSIASQNITTKGKAPDLSNVGADKKADWIAKFVTKQEKLDGKQHGMMFKGTPEELKTLSTWLGTMKKAAK